MDRKTKALQEANEHGRSIAEAFNEALCAGVSPDEALESAASAISSLCMDAIVDCLTSNKPTLH